MTIYIILGLSLLFVLVRFAKGPLFWDRIVCLDLLTVILIGLLLMHHSLNPTSAALDGALVLSLVSFIGPVYLAWVRS